MENENRPPEANEPAIPPYEDRADSGSKDAEEAGRHDAGSKGGSDRPAGESTGRDFTSVDPQDDD